jgi:heme-degrading monooxygenase HmoA
VSFQLAQVNIARLKAPLEAPELADFVAALDPVNASADSAPGFVWRLQTEDGSATAVRAFEWDEHGAAGVIVNLSVWESVDALADWVYSGLHREVLRRRAEWFHRVREAMVALWWVSAGTVPSVGDAEARVRSVRTHGPTPYAFTFRELYSPSAHQAQHGSDDWLCPA